MGIKQRCGFFRVLGKMRIPQQGIRNKRQKTAKRRQLVALVYCIALFPCSHQQQEEEQQ